MIERTRLGNLVWHRRSKYGERLHVDSFAARLWLRNRGSRWRAAREARAELSELGFGIVEIITIVYYLLKIWKLIQERFGTEADDSAVHSTSVAQIIEEHEDV